MVGFINLVFFSRHISPDKFYIEPRDPQAVGEKILEIDRVSQELTLAGKNIILTTLILFDPKSEIFIFSTPKSYFHLVILSSVKENKKNRAFKVIINFARNHTIFTSSHSCW